MTQLQQIGTTRVYSEPVTTAGPPGFLLFVAGPAATLSPSLTVAHAWNNPQLAGWLVFLPAAPAPPFDALAAALQAMFASAPAHTSLAWSAWDATTGTVMPPQRLALRGSGEDVVVDGDSAIGVGSRYGIEMKDGNPVLAAIDSDLVSLAVSYVPRSGPPPFVPPPSEWPPPNGIGCTIPFHGPSRFCLLALGLIGDPSDASGTGADVSIRYFVNGVNVRYPLLESFGAGVLLVAQLTLDPCTNWWAPGGPAPRTTYDVTGEMYQLAQTGDHWTISPLGVQPFASCLRTTSGQPVGLRPVAGAFVPQPLAGSPGEWYLTPSGTFALQAPVGAGPLLCGLAATELISFDDGDLITFVAGSNAHTPVFPLQGATTPAPPTLDSAAVTAWATVTPVQEGEASPTYSAQPKSAALYAPAAGSAATPIVPVFTTLVADLRADNPPLFPLAPYAGVAPSAAFPATSIEQFEQQILMPLRRQAIAASPGKAKGQARLAAAALAAGGTATTTTTPQGFLVDVTGARWSNLTFASNARSDGTQQTLEVAAVSPQLQDALQSSDVFLVVTNNANFTFSGPVIPISDWPFRIDLPAPPPPGSPPPAAYSNVLLFKFCRGTMIDLVANSSALTAGSDFNSDLQSVSTWLQNYFQAAKDAAANNDAYANFVSIIADPHWTGILALQVDVPLNALPEDLRGLAVGIDASQFNAHHLGINATRVTLSNGTFMMPAASSLFGLINYSDSDSVMPAPAGGDPGFSFRVLTLFARFENSQIVQFQSTIVLTVTELFGEAAVLQGDGSQPVVTQNAIVLQGTLERRTANDGSTIIVYVFLGTDDDRFVTPKSPILNYVDVTKTEFQTLKPPQPVAVISQFKMWGFLNFKVLPTLDPNLPLFDVFSFGGDPADSQHSGLAFSNLIVQMEFQDTPPVGPPTFTFRPDNVGFDLATSSAPRPNSLFAALPLSLNSIDSSASGTPQNAGYLPVLTAAVHGTDPLHPKQWFAPIDPQQWFALTNILDLGTMGALASLASFNAELLPAWSPGGDAPQVALLMKLPGTAAGKKLLSLQQVLKLTIGQIELVVQQQTPSLVIGISFLDVALDFLGIKKIPSGAVVNLALGRGSGAANGSLGWLASFDNGAGQ